MIYNLSLNSPGKFINSFPFDPAAVIMYSPETAIKEIKNR